MASAVLTAMAISSCDENTVAIGQSLTNEEDEMTVASEVFNVQTRTVIADTVFNDTNEGHSGTVFTQSSTFYLGMVRDPETQADVKSEFATQFHLLDVITLPDADKFVNQIDGKPIADSCDLVLYISNPFNVDDTLSSIKMTVHELKTTLESSKKYYSDFNPMKLGMVREEGLNKNKMFAYKNLLDSDSLRNTSSYLNNIRISLNEPYTDKNGVEYNNYGTYIIRQYHEHPEYFNNSYALLYLSRRYRCSKS